MRDLKKYCILGFIVVSIIGTFFHFIYDLTNKNTFVAFFAPINESIWEHLKLTFFPMVLWILITSGKLKYKYPCYNSAIYFSTIFSTILVPILYYTYSGILGSNYALIDISIFFISIITSFYLTYKLSLNCKVYKYENLLFGLILIGIGLFFIFTIYTPDIDIFLPPKK